MAGRSIEYLWIPLSAAILFGLWIDRTDGLATVVALVISTIIAIALARYHLSE